MNSGFADFVAVVIFVVGVMLPVMKVIHRAGYSRWWILLATVPLINLVMLWIFASTKWPIEERLENAEAELERALANLQIVEGRASGTP